MKLSARRLLALPALITCALAAPAAASADSTFTNHAGALTIVADDNANDIKVNPYGPTRILVSFGGAAVASSPADCFWVTGAGYSCPSITSLDIDARGGDDVIYFDRSVPAVVHGGDGNDDITQNSSGASELHGDGGDDTLHGGHGADMLYGDAGNDKLLGGYPSSTLADELHGGDGVDQLNGAGGADQLYGEAGNDTLYASGGNDTVDGGYGADQLNGHAGDDTIIGGDDASSDTLAGLDGNDTLNGGGGGDQLLGQNGNDTLNGGDGDDFNMDAGAGNDTLDGGAGRNTLTGGDGDDTFKSRNSTVDVTVQCGAGLDNAEDGDVNDIHAGDCEETPATAGAPVITLTQKPAALTAASPPPLTFTVSEATSALVCQLDAAADGSDDNTWTPCATSFALNAAADGTYTVRVRATDRIGKTGTAEHAWAVDATAPSVTFTNAPEGAVSRPEAEFAFSSDDAAATLACKLDEGSWAACQSPYATGALAEGAHTLTVRATDTVGNAGVDTATWTVDTTAPSVTIDHAPQGTVGTPEATIEFSADEQNLTFECQLNGDGWKPCASPADVTVEGDGEHSFEVIATDAAGNESAIIEHTWTLDMSGPKARFTNAPFDQAINTPSTTIAFDADEADATFECQLDGGAWTACESPYQTGKLADGDHTLSVRALDALGNRGLQTNMFWTIDTTPPVDPQPPVRPETPVTPQPPVNPQAELGQVTVTKPKGNTVTVVKNNRTSLPMTCSHPQGCAATQLPFVLKAGKLKLTGKIKVPALKSGEKTTVLLKLTTKQAKAFKKAGAKGGKLQIKVGETMVNIKLAVKANK